MTEYPKTLTVRVSQEDIDHGEKGDAMACPISLAVHRQSWLPDNEAVLTWPEQISIGTVAQHWTHAVYPTTKTAQRFMTRFDTGKPVQPATFRFRREAS